MISSCVHTSIKVKTNLGTMTICRPQKEAVVRTKKIAKDIFVEAFSTTYTAYHLKSRSVETVEKWLRLKEGLTIDTWLSNVFDDEYAEYEKEEKHFLHLYNESQELVGWLSHSTISEKGEVYLSQCSLEGKSRNRKVASTIFHETLQQEVLQKLFPKIKEIKLIARKINEYADKVYLGSGFTKDLSIDPNTYGDSYDDRYVGYRKVVG